MDDHNAQLAQARALLDDGQDLQSVLRFLRASGCNVIDSIKATMQLTGVSLAEAKRIVHASEAWSDVRSEHDAFHDRLVDALITTEANDVAVAHHRRDGRS